MILGRARKTRKHLQLLIDKAVALGLPDVDIVHASEFLKYGEYGLCLDHVATQLYEYGIAIDDECYRTAIELSDLMLIPQTEYSYLAELLPT
jgi:hypothetical protein